MHNDTGLFIRRESHAISEQAAEKTGIKLGIYVRGRKGMPDFLMVRIGIVRSHVAGYPLHISPGGCRLPPFSEKLPSQISFIIMLSPQSQALSLTHMHFKAT